jgi:uncharacterized protein YacL
MYTQPASSCYCGGCCDFIAERQTAAAKKASVESQIECMSKSKDDEFYLCFIVRSIVMGLLGAVIFSVTIWLLNTSKLLYVLSISVAKFFIVLFITRLFDRQTKRLVEMILERLDNWPKAKNFLLRNF